MSTRITMDEWVAELQRVGLGDDPEGYTANEIAEALGRGIRWTRERMRAAIEDGTLEYAGRKRTTAIDGRAALVPVYRLVAKRGRKRA